MRTAWDTIIILLFPKTEIITWKAECVFQSLKLNYNIHFLVAVNNVSADIFSLLFYFYFPVRKSDPIASCLCLSIVSGNKLDVYFTLKCTWFTYIFVYNIIL